MRKLSTKRAGDFLVKVKNYIDDLKSQVIRFRDVKLRLKYSLLGDVLTLHVFGPEESFVVMFYERPDGLEVVSDSSDYFGEGEVLTPKEVMDTLQEYRDSLTSKLVTARPANIQPYHGRVLSSYTGYCVGCCMASLKEVSRGV